MALVAAHIGAKAEALPDLGYVHSDRACTSGVLEEGCKLGDCESLDCS